MVAVGIFQSPTLHENALDRRSCRLRDSEYKHAVLPASYLSGNSASTPGGTRMDHRLNILGTLDLRDADGAAVSSILQQPRRLGLLVYLAMADRDGMVKRDTLLGLFWPDMTQENGRRALSQAIHF